MTAKIAVIKATLKYSTQEELIKGMAPLISPGGLFIHTKATRPEGSEVHFEFQLADGSITYSGEGVVKKEIPYETGGIPKKSGMLISLKRINRPFKTVVDTILSAQEAARRAEQAQPSQQIVESRVDKSNGFSFFDDVDLDSDLDSLFNNIQKTPAPKPVEKPATEDSGMFEQSSMVSGLFERPSNEDAFIEYESEAEGESFDGGRPFPRHQSSIHGIFEEENTAELQKRTTAKTGEFQEEANEVLEAEREKSRLSSLGQLPEAFEKRISPAVTQSHMAAITGKFVAAEDLAKKEREHASQQSMPQAMFRQNAGLERMAPTRTLQGYAMRNSSQMDLKRDESLETQTLQGYALKPDELARLRAFAHGQREELPQSSEEHLSEDYHLDEPMTEDDAEIDEDIAPSDLPDLSIEGDLFGGDDETSDNEVVSEEAAAESFDEYADEASDNEAVTEEEASESASDNEVVAEEEASESASDNEVVAEEEASEMITSDNEVVAEEEARDAEYAEDASKNDSLEADEDNSKLADEMKNLFGTSKQQKDEIAPDIADQVENLFGNPENAEDSDASEDTSERSHTFDSLFPAEEESPSGLFQALRDDVLGEDEFENAMTTEFVKGATE